MSVYKTFRRCSERLMYVQFTLSIQGESCYNYFIKKFHVRYLTDSYIRLCQRLLQKQLQQMSRKSYTLEDFTMFLEKILSRVLLLQRCRPNFCNFFKEYIIPKCFLFNFFELYRLFFGTSLLGYSIYKFRNVN